MTKPGISTGAGKRPGGPPSPKTVAERLAGRPSSGRRVAAEVLRLLEAARGLRAEVESLKADLVEERKRRDDLNAWVEAKLTERDEEERETKRQAELATAHADYLKREIDTLRAVIIESMKEKFGYR